MNIDGLEIPPDVLRLAESCDYEAGHTRQVCYLAVRLFDELQDLHKLPDHARKLLIDAAMLHDIGWCRGGKGHHKTAYEIVTEKRPPSLSPDQAEIVGLVGRYHRKAPPSLNHPPFARLSVGDREMVRMLAAILRVADGLDRGHQSVVPDVSCDVQPGVVTLWLDTTGPAHLEIWGAERKADVFTDVFGRRLSIKER